MDRTKVALFDLDNAFVTINSTFSFVEFYAVRHFRNGKLLKFFWTWVLYYVGNGWFMREDKRDVWLRFLAGEDEATVRSAGYDFFRERLVRAIDNNVASHFHKLRKEGYRTVLVSASIDPVVDAFASSFHFDDWFSGKLLVRDRRYAGILAHDVRGEKVNILGDLEKKYGALDLAESYFFTDNKEDLPLAKKIGNSYGVIRGNFEGLFWEEHGIRTISATPTNIPPKRFLIPLTYFLLVRNASLLDKHLWFFFIGFPMFSLVIFRAFSIENIAWMFLSIAGFYALYEIGYFVNDFMSVRGEKNPTIRFDTNAPISSFWFIANRILFFCALVALLFSLYPHQPSIMAYIVANLLITAIFAIHNAIKGRWRLLTFPFMKISHLIVPVVLFPEVNIFAVATAVALLYLPGNLFIYIRKVNDEPAPDREEMMRYVVYPTCVVMIAFLSFGVMGILPLTYFFLGSWLFLGHFVKILKLAYKKRSL